MAGLWHCSNLNRDSHGKTDIHGFTGVRTTPWWVAGVIATGGHMVIALLDY